MTLAEPPQSTATPRRFHWGRLVQYRLRTLLIVTTIVAVGNPRRADACSSSPAKAA